MIYNKQTVEMCENIAKFYEEKTGYEFIKMGFDVSDNSMILFFDLKRDPSTTRFLQPGSLKEIPDEKDRTEFLKLHGIFLQDVMIMDISDYHMYEESFNLDLVEIYTIRALVHEVMCHKLEYIHNGQSSKIKKLTFDYDMDNIFITAQSPNEEDFDDYDFINVSSVTICLENGVNITVERGNEDGTNKFYKRVTENFRYTKTALYIKPEEE